jgi:hypothetical protein
MLLIREIRMFSSRLRRLLGSVCLTAMLLVPAAGIANAAGATCSMTVDPASGPPGTQFTFKGSGFTPTEFRLTQGTAKKVVAVELNGADPWEYAFVGMDADVGRWKVVAAVDGSGCQAVAHIRVGLPSTSTVLQAATPDKTPALAALAGLTIVFVVSTGLVLGRSRKLA